MTVEETADRGKAVVQTAKMDPESAHGSADKLMADVLYAISQGTAEDPKSMAWMAYWHYTKAFEVADWWSCG